jgi:hypothetical protein
MQVPVWQHKYMCILKLTEIVQLLTKLAKSVTLEIL